MKMEDLILDEEILAMSSDEDDEDMDDEDMDDSEDDE